MRTFPVFAFGRKVLLLSALAHLTSLALALPQSQGAPSYTLSSSTSTTSSSTHLSPSLIHSSLPTPTADNDLAERNDQGADVTTETVFSTIIIPTATELTTILTVVTSAPHVTGTPSTTTASASTSKPAGPNPHCIVEGGQDGICVTVVPIWPIDTLAQAVKRQVNSETHSVSYYSTALVTSLVVVNLTTTKVLTAIHAPNTTYTLTGPLTTSSAPLSPTTTTAPVASTSTTTTTVSCASPSWLIDGRCVYNTPGWNPAPHVPTHPPRMARAVQTHLPKILEKEQVKRGEEEKEEEQE
ncbi:hypothetical protein N0V85_003682 [Neurospora sp. IMI 360204]|nr:hypothetical protein N0V85_003682 [Neurospora sp. IMI 360204]